ncbi:MAG: winged helix-turn-helix transcriptional regulator [Candidatus Odinarchaeota archaeon]
MDNIDKVILLDLSSNCRLPYQTLAKKLKVSSNAVKKRVDRLIEEGVIERFSIELSLEMFGGDVALIILETDGTENEQEFCDNLGENPMIGLVGPCSGSMYMLFATYIGTTGLSELGVFLRTRKSVKSVEIFPLIYPRGKRVKYSKSHLKVLRCLVEDARMPVADIAHKTGLSARTVRRLIDEIIEGEGVSLSLSWDLNASDGIVMIAKTTWIPEKTNIGDMVTWFNSQFPEFYTPIIAASEPVIFAAFVGPDLKRLDEIAKRISGSERVKSVISILGRPLHSYTDLRKQELDRLLSSYGYNR